MQRKFFDISFIVMFHLNLAVIQDQNHFFNMDNQHTYTYFKYTSYSTRYKIYSLLKKNRYLRLKSWKRH